MKPVCVPCERFMRPKRNGYYFIEGAPDGSTNRFEIGKGAPGWQPYKIWCGDLWHCPTCGTETVVGVGSMPITVQHQSNFKDWLSKVTGVFVKDC